MTYSHPRRLAPRLATRFARLALIGFPLLLLAACSSAPTRVYSLYAVTSRPAVTGYAGPPLRIDAVHLPPALNRVEVVTDLGHGEKRINDLDHWSAPLAQLVRQTLTEELAARLPSGTVIYPNLSKPEGALGIEVDILEFGAPAGGGAVLMASYTLGRGGAAAARWNASLSSDASPSGDAAPAATVRIMSELLRQLADHIASDVTAAAAQSPQ